MNQRVTENDAYVNSCVTEILCRALSDDEWTLARDVWLDWYPKNRGGWFHWSRAFGGFLYLWRAHRSKLLAESGREGDRMSGLGDHVSGGPA